MKSKNLFWGFFLILSALFVIFSQFNGFGEVSVVSLFLSILFGALFIDSVIRKNFFGIFVNFAFLYHIYSKPLHFKEFPLYVLLLCAILAASGFSIIFRNKPKTTACKQNYFEGFNQVVGTVDDNTPYEKVSFGEVTKYLHSDCLKGGQLYVSFGSLKVFFENAQLDTAGAEIFIDCNFGSLELYIPKTWKVIEKMKVSLAGVENKNYHNIPQENAPTLTLTGNVSFGSVEIRYI